MSSPSRRSSADKNASHSTSESRLRLVNGGPETIPPEGPKSSETPPPSSLARRWGGVALAVGSLLLTCGLVYFCPKAPQRAPAALPSSPLLAAVSQLTREVRSEGMSRYSEHKEDIRKKLVRALSDSSSEEARTARNLAVYLFPELLAAEDFEREEAVRSWIPLEQAIEKAPGQRGSRRWLEALRAAVWNYESPRQRPAHLSPSAAETLSLFEAIAIR